MGLGRYIWYKSQTPSDVPIRRLSPEDGVPAMTLGPEQGGLEGHTSIGMRE